MEHFGFLVKSSQTLNALPDLPGEVYWTPVDDVAATLVDLVLSETTPYRFYHNENPVSQTTADALSITSFISFQGLAYAGRTTS
ncbi:hypothetical protein EV127DRAFT_447303 [Xylaria flabelliformis]|nr:hypothetical protein EV127DRAFT_447303 [Xylaria flabelliformis]